MSAGERKKEGSTTVKSYENAVRYLAKENAEIQRVHDAKQSNYLAGAYEISEVLGNQLVDMMKAQREHVYMVAYVYDMPTSTVYRDMSKQAKQQGGGE